MLPLLIITKSWCRVTFAKTSRNGRCLLWTTSNLKNQNHKELKRNIRVLCRVRPLLTGENFSEEARTISYPTSLKSLGRGIDLMQNGEKLNNRQQNEYSFE